MEASIHLQPPGVEEEWSVIKSVAQRYALQPGGNGGWSLASLAPRKDCYFEGCGNRVSCKLPAVARDDRISVYYNWPLKQQ